MLSEGPLGGEPVTRLHAQAVDLVRVAREVARSSTWTPSAIKAGEHIAAIMIATFLECGPPVDTDSDGGIDLRFAPGRNQQFGMSDAQVAFEVKSMPGSSDRRQLGKPADVRYWEAQLDRLIEADSEIADEARSLEIRVESVDGIFDAARHEIDAAINGLDAKARDDSRNVFLIVDWRNFCAAEYCDPLLAPSLPNPQVADIETLWLHVHRFGSAVWSTVTAQWTELLPVRIKESEADPELFVEAEEAFLAEAQISVSSPWLHEYTSSSE